MTNGKRKIQQTTLCCLHHFIINFSTLILLNESQLQGLDSSTSLPLFNP